MSRPDRVAPGRGLILLVPVVAGAVSVGGVNASVLIAPAVADDQGIERAVEVSDTESQALNPHSDLIFRATGATSCRDCHRVGKSGGLSSQPIDNDLVRALREKAKGIHGPGRFADCLRCHAGGRKGVENYSP